jgi:hypothetical protein
VKKTQDKIRITGVQGYPLWDIPRMLWTLWKFQRKFNQATPEQQERAMDVLASADGVRVVRDDR